MKYDILLLNSRNILLSEKSMDIQQINQEIWYLQMQKAFYTQQIFYRVSVVCEDIIYKHLHRI